MQRRPGGTINFHPMAAGTCPGKGSTYHQPPVKGEELAALRSEHPKIGGDTTKPGAGRQQAKSLTSSSTESQFVLGAGRGKPLRSSQLEVGRFSNTDEAKLSHTLEEQRLRHSSAGGKPVH